MTFTIILPISMHFMDPFLLLFFLKQRSVYVTKVWPNCNYVRRTYFSSSRIYINTNLLFLFASSAADTRQSLSDGMYLFTQSSTPHHPPRRNAKHFRHPCWFQNKNGIPVPLVYHPVTASTYCIGLS